MADQLNPRSKLLTVWVKKAKKISRCYRATILGIPYFTISLRNGYMLKNSNLWIFMKFFIHVSFVEFICKRRRVILKFYKIKNTKSKCKIEIHDISGYHYIIVWQNKMNFQCSVCCPVLLLHNNIKPCFKCMHYD